ncbi:MAG: proton-conducting transporter membrane subunit [Bryobacteraceae bacterium]
MFEVTALTGASLAAYLLLAAVTIGATPRQDLRNRSLQLALLLVISGTAVAYLAASPWIFLAGWVLTLIPMWIDSETYGARVRVLHAVSTAALAAGILAASKPTAAFALLAVATLLRKGVFPFHFWVPSAAEKGPLAALALVLNGHLGAYLLVRFATPMYPEVASEALSLIGALAILTSVYGAFLGLAAKSPRRVLALLSVSQAAFILAGLENRNVEGITGALIHWWVVAFTTCAMFTVYRALELRTAEAAAPRDLLGLGFHAPRLAVFFAVPALALVGLPATLGFAAEDLLFHGSLESHPLLGIGLPLATALNAITALRLFATLFLGRRGIHVPRIPDALPRERVALALSVVLLVVTGVWPAAVVSLRTPAAEQIAQLLGAR